jgi:hypothetical protein
MFLWFHFGPSDHPPWLGSHRHMISHDDEDCCQNKYGRSQFPKILLTTLSTSAWATGRTTLLPELLLPIGDSRNIDERNSVASKIRRRGVAHHVWGPLRKRGFDRFDCKNLPYSPSYGFNGPLLLLLKLSDGLRATGLRGRSLKLVSSGPLSHAPHCGVFSTFIVL